MFTFANPLLLWAFPVLALPWLFRRRQEERIQKVNFPLLDFLLESEQKERINPLLQEWLLLLLRTLLLALLLLTLAGPRWVSEPGQQQRLLSFLPFAQSFQANVVVLDESYSMGYTDGDNAWWQRAGQAVERLDQELPGLSTDWYRWSREALPADASQALTPLSISERNRLLTQSPRREGASVIDLSHALQQTLEGNESLLLITDGQAYPWRSLLEADAPAFLAVPPMLVVQTGQGPVKNTWVEVDTLSTPPWGIAGWETIAGKVLAIQPQEQEVSLSILREETGETVYSQALSLPAAQERAAEAPFVFSTQFTELIASLSSTESPILNLNLELTPEDPLPLDNTLSLEVSTIESFQVAVAGFPASPGPVRSVLASAFDTAAKAEAESVITVRNWGPGQTDLAQTDLLLTAQSRAEAWWTAAHTSAAMEYVKQGGAMIVFLHQSQNPNPEWSRFIEGLDWTWHAPQSGADANGEALGETPSNADVEEITVWSDGALAQALAAWPEKMWRRWLPPIHGTVPGRQAQPLVAYSVGDEVADLIVGNHQGKGNVWLVNSVLDQNSATLLSPVLPAFLWESAKYVARMGEEYQASPPPPRPESNLLLLTEDDKQYLAEHYNIRFANLETLSEEIDALYGGTDLRMVLLLCIIGLALVESYLANKLASL